MIHFEILPLWIHAVCKVLHVLFPFVVSPLFTQLILPATVHRKRCRWTCGSSSCAHEKPWSSTYYNLLVPDLLNLFPHRPTMWLCIGPTGLSIYLDVDVQLMNWESSTFSCVAMPRPSSIFNNVDANFSKLSLVLKYQLQCQHVLSVEVTKKCWSKAELLNQL